MASSIIIRSSASTAAMESWLRTEIAALDPVLPAEIRPFREHVGELAARPRFQAWLLAMFAGIGLLLAAFGLTVWCRSSWRGASGSSVSGSRWARRPGDHKDDHG